MNTTRVIAMALLLITGASVGVLAQNETAAPDASQPNETDEHEDADEAAGEEAETITICHVPPGNPDARHTIEVGAPAWQAHEGHGDHKGACEEDAEGEEEISEEESHEAESETEESEVNETDTDDSDEHDTEENETEENETDTEDTDESEA